MIVDLIKPGFPLVPNQSDQQIPPTKTQGKGTLTDSLTSTLTLASQNSATSNPELDRLIELFGVANAAQRTTILNIVEAIVGKLSNGNSHADEGGAAQKGLHNGLGN